MKARVRIALQILGCLVAVAVVARLVEQADAATTWRAATSAGPLVVTALVPFALGMALDAFGTVVLLRALGNRPTLAQMLPLRIASEALHITLPAGFVASDTATALLLEARCDVPLRDGVVVSIGRKWLVMRAHAAYIALGAVAGFPALEAISSALVHRGGLQWVVLASSLVPLALSAAVGAGLLGRSTFARLHAWLARLPSRRLSRWLEARRHQATATDAQATRLRGARLATGTATLSFLGAWCLEALESALLLHLVGARVDLSSVFALEAGLSLVRSAVVLAPSGLGVVDLGYATVLQALGADPGAAAAFVLLKRGKEAVWVAAGYGLLALLRAPQSSPSTSTSRRPASSTLTGNVRRWAHSVASGLPVVRSNAKP